MSTNSRKNKERELRKKEIIDSTINLIAENGFENTTMEDIAKKAEVSKGSLYLYFKDKSMLHLEIKKRALIEIKEKFLLLLNEDIEGAIIVESMGSYFTSFVKDNPVYTKAMSINDQSHPEYTEKCDAIENDILLIITRALQVGTQDGSIRADINPKILAIQIEFCLRGIVHFYLTNPHNHISKVLSRNDMAVSDIMNFFMEIILNQIDSTKKA